MTQTLGQYFKELRTSARRYPLLDRAAVEALGDKLGAELARRFWGMPTGARRGGKSSHEAWVTHFLRQQAAQRCPTLRDVAKRAGLDTAAVWKIEHDKGVRGDTVRRALVDGLGFAPDSAEVRRALALLTARSGAGKVAVTALQTEIADVESPPDLQPVPRTCGARAGGDPGERVRRGARSAGQPGDGGKLGGAESACCRREGTAAAGGVQAEEALTLSVCVLQPASLVPEHDGRGVPRR